MIIKNGIIFIWTGTHANIPTGWSRVTDMDDKYAKGTAASTNPNTTGGAATHTHTSSAHTHTLNAHTHTITVGAGSGGGTATDASTDGAVKTHTHANFTSGAKAGDSVSSEAATYGACSNNPLYHKVIFVTPTTYVRTLPAGIVALADAGALGVDLSQLLTVAFKNGNFEDIPSFVAAQTGNGWIDGTASGSATNDRYGWRKYSSSASNLAQFDTSIKHGGAAALKISNIGGVNSYNWVGTDPNVAVGPPTVTTLQKYGIPIKPNTAYKITFWWRGSGLANNQASILFNTRNLSGGLVDSPSVTGTPTDWEEKTLTFTSGATAAFLVVAAFKNGYIGLTSNAGDLWIDDIAFKKADDVAVEGAILIGANTVNKKIAQQFVPSRPNLQGIKLKKFYDYGSFTGDVVVSIVADNSDAPTGATVATKTITNADWLALSSSEESYIELPASVTPASKYWIIFAPSTTSDTNLTSIVSDNNFPYAGGLSADWNGSAWANRYKDLYFKTIYTIPALNNFKICDGIDSTPALANKFLLGAGTGADAGATGGSNQNTHALSHAHTTSHTHASATSGNASGTVDRSPDTGGPITMQAHTHAIALPAATPSTTDDVSLVTAETDIEPAYTKLLAIQNAAVQRAPLTIIALWLGTLATIPKGWILCDGSGGTVDMRDRHLKITATASEVGATGGSNTHTHASQNHGHTVAHTHSTSKDHVGITAYASDNSGLTACTTATAHAITTDSVNLVLADSATAAASSNNEPPYRTVAFIKLKSYLSTAFLMSFIH